MEPAHLAQGTAMIPVETALHRGVLLDFRDVVSIQRPTGQKDDHGWVLNAADGGAVEVARVRGSVQWSMPRSENSMTTSGNGPHSPALTRTAVAYLPSDCGVRAGDLPDDQRVSDSGGPVMDTGA